MTARASGAAAPSLVHVLVVEADDAGAPRLAALVEREGPTTSTASTAQAATARCRDGGFDLIVLRHDAARLDGLALTRALRATGACDGRPIVLVLPQLDHASRLAALEAGADALLQEPVDPAELALVLRNALRLGARAPLAACSCASVGAPFVCPAGELLALSRRARLADAAIESASLGIAFADREGRLTRFNAPALALWGYSREDDVLGRSVLDFWREPAAAKAVVAHLATDGAWQGQLVARCADGSERTLHVTAHLIPPEAGGLAQMMASFRDVSELERTRARLEQAQRRAHLGHWDWNIVDGGLEWSDETYRIFGLDPASGPMTYERFLARLPLEARRDVEAAVARALAAGERYELVHRIVRPDGTERLVRETADLALDPAGRPVHMFGTCQDVTELHAREREVHRSNRLLRAAIETAPLTLFALDADGRVTVHEGRAFERFGADFARLEGRRPWEALPEAQMMEGMFAAAMAGEQQRFTISGGGRTVEMSSGPLVGASGRVEGMIGAALDRTEEAQLQHELANAQRLEALGTLAGGVAHDFNNLLTIIQCATAMAAADLADDARASSDLAQVRLAAGRAEALTQQLLALGRRQLVFPVAIDPGTALAGAIHLARPLLGAGVRVELRPTLALPRVLIDPAQFDHVMVNLLANARDAMAGQGVVRVGARAVSIAKERVPGLAAGDYVEVVVEDEGVGMDEATLARIFEPFFTTRKNGAGTGLGLPTALGIVVQLGGTITASSTPGAGASFHCFLPVTREEVCPGPAPSPAPTPAGVELLIVEDDPNVLRLASRILRAAGHGVTTATDGAAALELLAEAPARFAIVVTDLVMPGLDGVELERHARTLGVRAPFLLVTGYAEDAAIRFGVSRGAHVVLQKPYTPSQLTARVAELLSARAKAPAGA